MFEITKPEARLVRRMCESSTLNHFPRLTVGGAETTMFFSDYMGLLRYVT